jgi:hypothetical protein
MKPRLLVLILAVAALFTVTSTAATPDHLSHLKMHAAVCLTEEDILREVALNKNNDLGALSQMFVEKRLFFTTSRLLIRVDHIELVGCFAFHMVNDSNDVFWGLLRDLED